MNGAVSVTYDNNFRVTSRTVGGSPVSYTYDNDGLLTGSGALTLSRDVQNGLLTGTTIAGVNTTNTYNIFGEISAFNAFFGVDNYQNTYTRDKLGRITQKVEVIQGVTTTTDYVYDVAGRLTGVAENGAATAVYQYDSNGNRIGGYNKAGGILSFYDAQDRLTGWNNNSYTYTANVGTATQVVTVVDTTAPVITAPAAITASSGDNLPVTILTGTATATDLFTVTITSDAPATFSVGVTTVTYTATDANGNAATATQLVTVNLVDVTAPVVTAPIAVTAEATGAATTVILGSASATDAVDGVLIPTNDAPVGGFPVGVTTITYSAADLAGNIGTATQLVTITDTIAPVITAPVGVTANSINGADVTVALGTATASDLFAVTISSDAPVTFPVGITTVTWTATDANGNTSAATQLVTVSLVDTLPPAITVPANVSVSTNTSQATVDIGIASATDNIDGIVAVTNNAPATFPVGATAVIYTASDSAGNTATATQNIYVSFSSTIGGGSGGGTTTLPPTGGGATVTSENVYWHHNDHLGTPQKLTNSNGIVVWEMGQTPFGIATVNEDPDGDGLTVMNDFRFPGQYFDAETGHHYNRFRTYDPDTGYTQHDPIGLNGGPNPYAYSEGNPISKIDPYGLSAGSVAGAATLLCARYPKQCAAGVVAASNVICQAAGGCSVPVKDTANSEQCQNKDNGKSKCKLQIERVGGKGKGKVSWIPEGRVQCTYECKTDFGVTKITRIMDGNQCPREIDNMVPGDHGF